MQKTALLLLPLIATLLAGAYFYNSQSNTQEEVVIGQRNFFKQVKRNTDSNKLQAGEDEVAPIITYGIKHIMQVDQFAQDPENNEVQESITVIAQCDVQTIYNSESNEYEIAVSYSKIDRQTGESDERRNLSLLEDDEIVEDQEDGELYDFEQDLGEQEVVERNDLFYLLTVQADSGKVLTMKRETSEEDMDQTLNWITQQLINDIFPEMRRESYTNKAIEEDNLGEMAVEYKAKDAGSAIEITKHYDSEDYVSKNIQSLNTPEIEYERTIYVEKDTGIVDEGQSNFKFEVGEHTKLQSGEGNEDGENIALEALGEIEGKIQQTFWLVPPTVKDGDIAKEMMRYRSTADFEDCKLSQKQKGGLDFGDGEAEKFDIVDIDEPTEVEEVSEDEEEFGTQVESLDQEDEQVKLTSGGNFYKVNELAGIKIFGSRVKVDMIYSGNANRSNVYADLKVNAHLIRRLIHVSWNNCRTSATPYSRTHDITLFKAGFPVFGIITINVSARTRIQYGMNRGVNTGTRYCQTYVKPWFKAALYADGKASLAGVISAGIYGQGNFLDANLNLVATTNNGVSSLSLTGNFRAFNVEVGLTYTRINCSFNNVRRKLEGERRSLGFRRKLKKIRRKARKVVRKVNRVVRNVNRVVRDAYHIARNLHKICQTSKGFKQLYKSKSPARYRTFYNQSIRYGI